VKDWKNLCHQPIVLPLKERKFSNTASFSLWKNSEKEDSSFYEVTTITWCFTLAPNPDIVRSWDKNTNKSLHIMFNILKLYLKLTNS
jgi:hypothetical protein